MEKVICNVYYNLTCGIEQSKTNEKSVIELGNFENKNDAQSAQDLFQVAIYYLHDDLQMKYSYDSKIEKFLKPENEKVDYYTSVNEFMVSNPYVVYYLEKYDPQLLEGAKKLLEDQKTEATQNFPHPHDALTDEEDNFC